MLNDAEQLSQLTDAFMQAWFESKHTFGCDNHLRHTRSCCEHYSGQYTEDEYCHLHHSQDTHRHVTVSPSTNSQLIDDILQRRLPSNQPHLLTADTQLSGRGQHGREWQSPAGNVYLSLFYPHRYQAHRLSHLASNNTAACTIDYVANRLQSSLLKQPLHLSGLLSLCIGQSLVSMPMIANLNDLLSSNNRPSIGVKWANDLGFYSSIGKASIKSPSIKKTASTKHQQPQLIATFHKLAGILIEPVYQQGELLGIVVGVGMNVQTAPQLNKHNSHQTSNLQPSNSQASVCLSALIDGLGSERFDHSMVNNLAEVGSNVDVDNYSNTTSNVSAYPLFTYSTDSPKDLYLPICRAIIQGILTHQALYSQRLQISSQSYQSSNSDRPVNCLKPSLQHRFMTDFTKINLLHHRWVCVNNPVLDSTSTAESDNNPGTKILQGMVTGIDVNGCLLIQQENGKVSRLFGGHISMMMTE